MVKAKSLLQINLSFSRVTLLQKSIFAKNLAVMLRSGLDIIESLEILADQAGGKFKAVILDILSSVEAGNSLSNSLKKHPRIFSKLFVNTAKAGESSGNLSENLENVGDYLRKSHELAVKIKSALVYPMIIVIGALMVGSILAFWVLPKIVPMFESLKVDLPLSTRILIASVRFLEIHRLSIILFLIFGLVFFHYFFRREFIKPYTHYLFLKMPIINRISINSNLANFCNTLGTMLKSGLTIDEALSVSKEVVGNYYFKKCLDDISSRTIQGSNLSDNLERYASVFPKMVVSMVRVGEKSGRLEDSLFNLGLYYESEVDAATKALSVAVEPILLILIGIFVGGLALSIITPIYKLTGSVGRR